MNCFLLGVLLLAANDLAADDGAARDVAIQGTARSAVSANFRIDSCSTAHDARVVAKSCEAWRTRLFENWRPEDAETPWKVGCHVVVHGSRQSYLSIVGRGGEASLGSSLLNFQGSKVSTRRIDLLADPAGELSALGHELTHVVVADYFGGKQLPRWADEGMAILADSHEKRRLHQRDLHGAVAQRQTFHAAELLALPDYPHPTRIPAFYGQSAWMVAFLCQREKPARFLEFVQQAMRDGHEKSLQDVYGLRGHAELDQLWRAELATGKVPGLVVTSEPQQPISVQVSP